MYLVQEKTSVEDLSEFLLMLRKVGKGDVGRKDNEREEILPW